MKAAVATVSNLLVALLACGDGFSPPAGLPFAAASYACWSATAIELAAEPITQGSGSPAFPYVSVMIQELPDYLRRGTWLAPSDTATAYYITGPNQYATGSGRVTIVRVFGMKVVEGIVDLQFGSRRITGAFRAGWVFRPVTCV